DEETDIVPRLGLADDLSLQKQSGGITRKVARIELLQDVDVSDLHVVGIAICVQTGSLVDARLASRGRADRHQKAGYHSAEHALRRTPPGSGARHHKMVQQISHRLLADEEGDRARDPSELFGPGLRKVEQCAGMI